MPIMPIICFAGFWSIVFGKLFIDWSHRKNVIVEGNTSSGMKNVGIPDEIIQEYQTSWSEDRRENTEFMKTVVKKVPVNPLLNLDKGKKATLVLGDAIKRTKKK